MAVEYRLTLAGDIPLEQVAELVAPAGVQESALPGYPRLLSADLRNRLGYTLGIYGGSNGYFDAEDDNGSQWEWKRPRFGILRMAGSNPLPGVGGRQRRGRTGRAGHGLWPCRGSRIR
ncbi:hypothetical protein GA0070216_1234 [Micromonospora matsumotoense]|uniref:Uncharacterized protein n=1 Tax=Micromonospora matsumotoense TaxID=121616 RepID=A0A1C5AR25_9ACTN|nr:hypothetical protein GA0070216_1234 [Micromonospora matsumotoense]